MPSFPTPAVVNEMREWCRTRRGSVMRIAAVVEQKNGVIGINHSAVSRTIAGRERNSLVVDAWRRLCAIEAALAKEAKRKKVSQ